MPIDTILRQYGLLGAIIIGLSAYIMFLHTMYGKRMKKVEESHNDERKEWLHTTKEFVGVVSSVKTLIESISNRMG